MPATKFRAGVFYFPITTQSYPLRQTWTGVS